MADLRVVLHSLRNSDLAISRFKILVFDDAIGDNSPKPFKLRHTEFWYSDQSVLGPRYVGGQPKYVLSTGWYVPLVRIFLKRPP